VAERRELGHDDDPRAIDDHPDLLDHVVEELSQQPVAEVVDYGGNGGNGEDAALTLVKSRLSHDFVPL
jgi:hypothetical protein